jgi:hypothetical protein
MKPIPILVVAGLLQPLGGTPLSRGSSTGLVGVTAASHPELAGEVLADKQIPFEIRDSLDTVILTAVYHSRVLRSATTGKLVFAGRITDTANPPSTFGWITHARLEGFGFVDVDVETRTDSLGDVPATSAGRDAVGDRLTFSIGPGYLNPPDESKAFVALTTADEFVDTGTASVFASNDFGGTTFSTTLEGVCVPVKPPLAAEIGERFFFETSDYHPIVVRGAAEGLVLMVETSPDLTPASWVTQGAETRIATAGQTTMFGEVEPAYGGRQFFRVTCHLPEG